MLLLLVLTIVTSAVMVPAESAGLVNAQAVPPQSVMALHQAALVRQSDADGVVRLTCSATVLAPSWVLTAAHCLQLPGLLLRSGSPRWDQGFTEHGITQVVIAPHEASADLALLRVSPPVNDSGIPLAIGPVPAGTPVRLTGWGSMRSDGPTSLTLLSAQTSVVSDTSCPGSVGLELCLEDVSGADVSPCFGDSGGGVLGLGPSGYVLLGVVSRSGTRSPDCTGSARAVPTAGVTGWIFEALRSG